MALQVDPPQTVTIDGRKMAYDEVSPPDPRGTILLLTGLAAKRLGWRNQLEVFGSRYRTVALDHRETGDSDTLGTAYTVADMADDAAEVLGALGVRRAHIVGISLGGFVALQLTLRHPELVDRLVLTSTSAGGATHVAPSQEVLALLTPDPNIEIGERARRNYARIMGPGFAAAHPEVLEWVAEVARYRPQAPDAYVRQLQAVLGHDAAERLGEIHVPTLVIHGEADPLMPPDNGRYLAAHIPDARLITYPGCGHIPILECADQYNRDVLAFLDGA
jgi:pimeloyl-ACP methyl ester carboxylesterase